MYPPVGTLVQLKQHDLDGTDFHSGFNVGDILEVLPPNDFGITCRRLTDGYTDMVWAEEIEKVAPNPQGGTDGT